MMMDEKESISGIGGLHHRPQTRPLGSTSSRLIKAGCAAGIIAVTGLLAYQPHLLQDTHLPGWLRRPCHGVGAAHTASPYGQWPSHDDPFLLQPCTNLTTHPPALDDQDHLRTWSALFDPNPDHWSWGQPLSDDDDGDEDPHAGRGIYLCGYLDVPMDYTNQSDSRIFRLAVTKFQASGLARTDGTSAPSAGQRSERTIVIEPGGPGGSGTSYVWRQGEKITSRFSDGRFDVLGWDPRGVNRTQPSVACFPYDADRDRWAVLTGQYREVSASPRAQLEVLDAMNDATFNACWRKFGDVPRFVSTMSVANDLERIREALGEDELTGYLVSYGTGIGQTYVNMFPERSGRVILDGTEYVRDHRLLGGFGWTALDNVTDAWHDGFLGECINAGPEHCALAKSLKGEALDLEGLQTRLEAFISSLIERPIIGYTDAGGPTLITYSALVAGLYQSLYNPEAWPAFAQMLSELEAGNSTLASLFLEENIWEYDPTAPSPSRKSPSTEELGSAVICADAYDAPLPDSGLDWWASLWANMTTRSWIAGNSRFFNVFPCRHYTKYWPEPSEVYRGPLDRTLRSPVLLIAEAYDPATPLRNGRRLLAEMGDNARLIAHHGYGHSSRDTSNCTETIARAFIMDGVLPEEAETACFADEKPYMYGVKGEGVSTSEVAAKDPVEAWREHMEEMAFLGA